MTFRNCLRLWYWILPIATLRGELRKVSLKKLLWTKFASVYVVAADELSKEFEKWRLFWHSKIGREISKLPSLVTLNPAATAGSDCFCYSWGKEESYFEKTFVDELRIRVFLLLPMSYWKSFQEIEDVFVEWLVLMRNLRVCFYCRWRRIRRKICMAKMYQGQPALEYWEATQKVLQGDTVIVRRPRLTEALLKKPPFRFLHDIITEVINSCSC